MSLTKHWFAPMSKKNDKQGKSIAKTEIGAASISRKPFASLAGFVIGKCRSAYYMARESLGQHKRDIVVYRVEDARDSLEQAKVQFESALDQFRAITEYDGGSLEEQYRQLKREFDYSRARADAVRERIRAIEEVAEALFQEWEAELEAYSNRTLRNHSRQKLKSTHQHYLRLIGAMKRAEAKIGPVITAFQDQVLYLKHNLNAQAIAALQSELVDVGIDIAMLIRAMEHSISEANLFMNSLLGQKALPGA